jgi:hypothetical protein
VNFLASGEVDFVFGQKRFKFQFVIAIIFAAIPRSNRWL